MKTLVACTAFLAASASALGAQAFVYWYPSSQQFDYGIKPSAAVGSGEYGNPTPAWEIEVHQGQPGGGSLWASSGAGDVRTGSIVGAAGVYDQGSAPALATYNLGSPANAQVIEVHQGAPGDLWYKFGSLSFFGGPSQTTWTSAWQYDHGYAPAVAATTNGMLVEVHQAGTGVGQLWARAGIGMGNSAHAYDNGLHPSVAVTDLGGAYVVVEVHQANAGVGPLWYRTGTIVNGSYVQWDSSHQYDVGEAPSITVVGDYVIEVHQANDGVGPLWSRTGTIRDGWIEWDRSQQYDYGYAPSVSYSPASQRGIEVHQAASGVGALWSHGFDVGQSCEVCNDGTCQCGFGSDVCYGHLGQDTSLGCSSTP
jgi:hypothetical protein